MVVFSNRKFDSVLIKNKGNTPSVSKFSRLLAADQLIVERGKRGNKTVVIRP